MILKKSLTSDKWRVQWISNNIQNIEFNIKWCLWYETLKKYNCTSLCYIFCHNDEILYKNLRKDLEFQRVQTLGNGGLYCDFHFIIKKETIIKL